MLIIETGPDKLVIISQAHIPPPPQQLKPNQHGYTYTAIDVQNSEPQSSLKIVIFVVGTTIRPHDVCFGLLRSSSLADCSAYLQLRSRLISLGLFQGYFAIVQVIILR